MTRGFCKFHGDTFRDFRASFACLRARETRRVSAENLAGPSERKRQTKFAKRLPSREISKFHERDFPRAIEIFAERRLRRIALKIMEVEVSDRFVQIRLCFPHTFRRAASFQFHLLILFHQV